MKLRITFGLICLFFLGMTFQSCQNSNATENKSQITKAPDKGTLKAVKQDAEERLGIGGMMPMGDLKMKDVSGKMVSLDDAMGENGLIINFSCNTCPFVVAWEDRYPMIEKMAKENNMGLVLLNSNEAKRQGDNQDDSFEAMQAHAKEMNYDCYYLVDENHKMADAMSAFTTPHIFIFDGDKKLVYKGAIDDNYKEMAKVENQYIQKAIKAVAAGDKVDPSETKGRGCSIKRLKS